MPFAADRDLLILEPNLFRDVQFRAQRIVSGSVSIAGNVLTFLSQDNGLVAASVNAGHVVVVGDESYEVVERVSDSELTVSRPREHATDEVIPPAPVGNVAAYISTFRPQIALVHRDLLARAEITDESQVQNPADLAALEAAQAVREILQACPLPERAARFIRLAERLAAHATIKLDPNADGIADATRRLSPGNLSRA